MDERGHVRWEFHHREDIKCHLLMNGWCRYRDLFWLINGSFFEISSNAVWRRKNVMHAMWVCVFVDACLWYISKTTTSMDETDEVVMWLEGEERDGVKKQRGLIFFWWGKRIHYKQYFLLLLGWWTGVARVVPALHLLLMCADSWVRYMRGWHPSSDGAHNTHRMNHVCAFSLW